MNGSNDLLLTAVPGIPLVDSECDIVDLVLAALSAQNLTLKTGDILVIAQTVSYTHLTLPTI